VKNRNIREPAAGTRARAAGDVHPVDPTATAEAAAAAGSTDIAVITARRRNPSEREPAIATDSPACVAG
jgi:hypothetical protein